MIGSIIFGGRLNRYQPGAAIALFFLCAGLICSPANAQVANDDTFTVQSNSKKNILDVLANDDSGQFSGFIWSVSTPDQGGKVSIVSSRSLLEYEPDKNFEGTETFTYSVLSGGFSFSTATVTIFVSGTNRPPVARDDEYSTDEDTLLDIRSRDGVLANDDDPDNDKLSATVVEGPTGGLLQLESNGGFTYRPTPGFSGEDSFSYLADDGVATSQPAVARIFVRPVDAPPIIDDIPDQTGNVGVFFELRLPDFVSDPDTASDALVYQGVSMPAGLTLSTEGLISGYPAPDAVGRTFVRFSVDDGTTEVQGQFRIDVTDQRITDVRISLVANPNPVAVGTTATWSIVVTNASNYTVDSAVVEGRISGEVPFLLDPFNDPGCMLVSAGIDSEFVCNLSPLGIGETAELSLTGSSDQAGDVPGTASVGSASSMQDAVAATTLSVAERINEQPAQSLPGFKVLALAAGDLDGDGHQDLAVATDASDSVLIFMNVIDPANDRMRRLASTPMRLGTDARDNDLALGDIDGDLDLDIVASGSDGQLPRVFVNDGSAAFQTITLDAAAHAASAVAVADINADGFGDIAFSGPGQSLVYFSAGVSGSFLTPLSVGNASSQDVAVSDLSGTGRGHLILANSDQDASIYRYNGSTFELDRTLPTGGTTSVAPGDFNGDGSIDLLFGRAMVGAPSNWPSNPVFLNESSSAMGFTLADELGAAPTFGVLAADSNAGGSTDAVVLNDTGAHQLFFGSGAGLTLAPSQLAIANASGAAVGNFSVDGRRDLAIGSLSGIDIFLSDSSGNFGLGDTTLPVITLNGSSSVEVTVGNAYSDPGATAMDSDDGDLTDLIDMSSTVNSNLIGSYTVTYRVWDRSGNAAAIVTRSVSVQPGTPVGGGGGGAFDPGTLTFLLLLAFTLTCGRQTATGAVRFKR